MGLTTSTRRTGAVTVALAVACAAAGCATTDTSPARGDAEPARAAADSGRPLDRIEVDRPSNSARAALPSDEVQRRQGGTCTLRGTTADCRGVPARFRPDAERLWRRTVLFFPPPVRARMTSFVLLPRGQGGGVADGPDGRYLFSLAFPTSGDVDHVIIHELGHGLEVTTQKRFAARWRRGFWTRADVAKAGTFVPGGGAPMEDNPLYRAAPGHFVHPYAATNPSEDFAETFRWFVLGVKPDGHSVRDRKILRMWAVPELVAVRARIQHARATHPGPLAPAR